MSLRRAFLVLLVCATAAGAAQRAQAETMPSQAGSATGSPTEVVSSVGPVLYVFYSPTCPHCRKEHAFLDSMAEKYPELAIRRMNVELTQNTPLWRELAKKYNATRSLGNVPMTFVGEKYFVGYQSDDTTGRDIEAAIRSLPGIVAHTDDVEGGERDVEAQPIDLPFLGRVDASRFSLPALAVLLGFLDGFNVCSLGALVLILGLALKLKRRRAIILFGGTYIVVTSLIYGGLIVVWYQIFDAFTAYITLMKVAVALLSLGGGIYFLKEYLRMMKQGAVCEISESPLITRLTERTGRAFQDTTRLLSVLGSVLVFAAVVTIVEFPCSAAVPVVFAGILAHADLSMFGYLAHIGLFTVFYMLDELIVFGVAAYKLELWMAKGTFTKWAALIEALVLLGIGVWYLGGTLGVF